MSTKIKHTRLLITAVVMLILTGATLLAIQIAKGYRPDLSQFSLAGTGLLSTTSYPKNAQVFVNDRLTTVTDNSLNLSPGEYDIKILKTGFHSWTKTVSIKPELVSTADARLFPSIPSITPLTFYQVGQPPLISPDGSKLLYLLTNSPFSQDNGLYVLSLANSFLAGNQITQIADFSAYDYTLAKLIWSPDSSQVLAVFHDHQKITASHILASRSINLARNQTDTTFRLPLLLGLWREQLAKVNQNNLARLPEFMQEIASRSAVNVYFSPDREKLLYTAVRDLEIPILVDKTIPSINPTPQNRHLTGGKTYVYDIKEDSNFLIKEAVYRPEAAQPLIVNSTLPPSVSGQRDSELASIMKQIDLLRGQYDSSTTQNLTWYSTNRHLVISNNDGVAMVEYDDNNLTPIISAQINGFAVGSPDGSRLVILTNLNQRPDLYNLISLDLK